MKPRWENKSGYCFARRADDSRLIEKELDGCPPDVHVGAPERGQGGSAELGGEDVVESDDTQVGRNSHAPLGEST